MEKRSDFCQSDDVFGPRVLGCREGFDFTLLFEQSILSILPSLLLLIVAIPRLFGISKIRNKTKSRSIDLLILAKLIAISCFGATQIALIALYASSASYPTRVSIAASCCSLCATLAIAALSNLEHHRSERPSLILTTYVLFTTLFDVCQARTLWLRDIDLPLPAVFTAGVAIKAVILLLETIEKRDLLQHPYRRYSPEALGGIINRSVFWWLNSLLFRGSAKVLRQEDLFPLDPQLSASSFMDCFRNMWSTCDKTGNHALLLATLKTFRKPLLLILFPRICLIGFTISQPLLINRAIAFLSQPDSQDKTNVGRALIGATALIYLGIAVSTAFYQHQIYRCITMIRGGLVSLVYEATLRLHNSDATNAAAVTLMSTDIDRIAAGMTNFDVLWAAPIQVGIAIYILWREIGLACIAPVVIAFGCTLAAFGLGKLSRKAQKVWVDAVQTRITATISMLNNIKGIRMSGLSSKLSTSIHDLRVKELEMSKSYRGLNAATNTIGILPQIMGPVTAFIIYVLLLQNNGSGFDPATAFTSLSLISLLSSPIFLFMFAFPPFTASIGCYGRIQEYLLSIDEKTNGSSRHDTKMSHCTSSMPDTKLESDAVELKSWESSIQNAGDVLVMLDRASFSFEDQGSPVLKEISFSIKKGSLIMLTGPVGSGKSTLLLAILGELFHVGGTLRRAPFVGMGFCGQTPWLPNLSIRQIIQGWSEFDSDWYTIIVNACVLEPDLATLPQGDQTVVGSRGTSLSGGQKQRLSLARALYAKKPLLLLDDVTSGLDAATAQTLVQRVLSNEGVCRRHGMSVLLTTHDTRLLHVMDTIITLSTEGRVLHMGPPSTVDPKDMIFSQDFESEDDGLQTLKNTSPSKEPDAKLTDLARKLGDFRLYLYYFNAMGWPLTTVFLLVSAAFTFCYSFPVIWLQWWSESESLHPGEHQVMYLVVYAGLGVSTIMLMFTTVWVLIVETVPRSSIKLHKILLDTVSSAPSPFFTSTDTGIILNRFSQDMSLVDMQLPGALLQTVDGVWECIASAILIAASSKWTALSYPALIVGLYILQKFYLSTSRQIRFLDLEAKSPLYSHFLETLHGLVTIRAFAWQPEFQGTNQRLLNDSQKPYYLMYCIQRWLNLILDLLVTVIAVTLMALATQVHGVSSGALGVALTNIVSFSRTLTYLIQAWTQMETSMGAISRLKSFTSETPSEHLPQETNVPSEDWPSRGEIQFKGLTVSYGAHFEPALRDITLSIAPGSKVGICGRSGSGKSSLILSILRLNEIQDGTVIIDDTDLRTVPRDIVRQGLTVLPQDPMILSGAVRFNIDPSGGHQDEDILSALAEVGMLDLVQSRGGLDSPLEASTLSSGQQQLMCLARALVNRSRILILDEATSNVDRETETKIIKLVQDRFQECTVLAVAHRLRTIRDFDVVVVLEQGRILEYGKPDDLLQQSKSRFRELWDSQH